MSDASGSRLHGRSGTTCYRRDIPYPTGRSIRWRRTVQGDTRLALAFEQRTADGPLLLADISGYTGFLQDVATAHRDDAFANGAVPEAYSLMSSLLDGIVSMMAPPFTLAKLEGDAVFTFATSPADVPHGDALLSCITNCYADFRRRLGEAGAIWTCTCTACARASTLDLKFILHAGPFVVQTTAGSRELMGPSVVMAHRLLKSQAGSLVDSGAYALITQQAAAMLDVPVADALSITETYEHYSPIAASVLALH